MCSSLITEALLSFLPFNNIISNIDSISYLSDSDIDTQLPRRVNFDYYNVHQFHSNLNILNCSKSSLSVIHCNIRSIQANFDSMHNMLTELKFPFLVIGLSETKLQEGKNPILNINLNGYSFISQPSKTCSGGVGMYIRENLSYFLRNDLNFSTSEFESIWIELQNNKGKNILISVFYRHPNSSLDIFLDKFYKIIDNISKQNKLCIIMGDFNINLLNCDSHSLTQDYINTLNSYSFQPTIIKPTRITHHSATLIDNIFINSIDYNIYSGNIIVDLSDHLPNFAILDNFGICYNKSNTYIRDYSKLNLDQLKDDYAKINFNSLLYSTSNSPNDLFAMFYKESARVVNAHVPLRKRSKREIKLSYKPWITPALYKSICIKNNLYKKYFVSRNDYYKSKYKYYRNRLKQLVLQSKKMYYLNYFKQHAKCSRNLWKGIKQIISTKVLPHSPLQKLLLRIVYCLILLLLLILSIISFLI